MNAVNANENTTSFKSGMKKVGKILLKVLAGIVIAAVVVLALVAIYKILEFLFVAAILLIGWVGIVPRRWR